MKRWASIWATCGTLVACVYVESPPKLPPVDVVQTFDGGVCRCGDGKCAPECGENATVCHNDCAGQDVCGDGTCTGTEDPTQCPVDCGECGDGYCRGLENTVSCNLDCGYCGDAICAGWGEHRHEDSLNCKNDCPDTDAKSD